jgi:tetratricopeptide (TPR) repeat protein/DNA-binding SARP family transcriptional activator
MDLPPPRLIARHAFATQDPTAVHGSDKALDNQLTLLRKLSKWQAATADSLQVSMNRCMVPFAGNFEQASGVRGPTRGGPVGSRFKILGRTQLLVDGRFDHRWGQLKLRGVLGALLLQAGQTLSIDDLIEWAWPDGKAPTQPATTFYKYASRIREALRQMRDPPQLTTDRGAYRIEVDRRDVDVFEFRSIVDHAKLLGRQGDHAGARSAFLSALDIWSDRPLADLDGARAQEWRHFAVTDLWIPAQGELMRELSALGEFEEVLHRLDELPPEHQTNPTVAQRRIEAYYGLRRDKDAATYFLRMRKRMIANDEHDAADDLTQFHTHLLRRDSDRPSIEVTHPAAAPSLAPRVPRLLPLDIPDFAGRHELLRMLDEVTTISSRVSTTGIVALEGEPGVGKTTLVVHWAHQTTDRFPGGQLYLDLNGASNTPRIEATTAVDRLLTELDFAPERIPSFDGRASRLRNLLAGRRAIVVLDNAENTEHVRPLVDCLPCLVIVTSRQRLSGLGRRGATNLSVSTLSYPDSRKWLANRIGPRAEAEPGAVTELASLCSGLALMLRVVAEHVLSRPPVRLVEFVDELRDAHALLGLGDDGDNPGGSARAAFAVSCRGLTAEEQRLFRLLGIHPGPDISLAAAAALMGLATQSTRHLLDALVDAHLLTQPEVRDRYRFHDLLRKYAHECVMAEQYTAERHIAEERMLNFYHHGAHRADMAVFPNRSGTTVPPLLDGVRPPSFSNYVTAIDWCIQERANLDAAIRYSGNHNYHAYAIGLPSSAGEVFQHLGYYEYFISALTVAVESARKTGNRRGQSYSLNNIGYIQLNLGKFESAESNFQMAKQLADEVGYPLGSAIASHNLARLQVERGDYRSGIEGLLATLATFRRIGAQGPEVNALCRLAEAHRRAHALDPAISFGQEALWLASKLTDEMNQGFSLTELGAALYEKGDTTSAKGHCDRALEIHIRLSAFTQAGKTSIILAAIHRDQGERPEAEFHARSSISFCHRGRDIKGEAVANDILADILYSQARHDEAIEAWSRALVTFGDIGDHRADAVRSRLAELEAALPLLFPEQTKPLVVKSPAPRMTPRD